MSNILNKSQSLSNLHKKMVPDGYFKTNTSSSDTTWSWEEDKLFETGLVIFPEETPDRWEKVASRVGTKTAKQIEDHYLYLVDDVIAIESGFIKLPEYPEDYYEYGEREAAELPKQISFGSGSGSKPKLSDSERKRGTPWTEEEHRLFLMGLQKYGKGDWRSISRNAVISRTPTQVASHAQKYFNRLNSDKKEKKRSSIHDIVLPEGQTSVAPNPVSAVPQQPMGPSGSQESFHPNNQGNIAPQNNPLQQGFAIQGGSGGYPNFGFPM